MIRRDGTITNPPPNPSAPALAPANAAPSQPFQLLACSERTGRSNDVANMSKTSEIKRAVTASGIDFPKCPTSNAIGVVMSINGSAARNLTSPRRAQLNSHQNLH